MAERRTMRKIHGPGDRPQLTSKRKTPQKRELVSSHQLVGYSNQGLRELRESLHEVAVSHDAVGKQRHALEKVVPRLGRGAEVTAEIGG